MGKNKIIYFLLLGIFGISGAARAEISSALEPVYADAVLAYNGRDYNRALQILNDLMKQNPDTPEFMELTALVLKNNQDEGGSADLYQKLIRLRESEGKTPKDVAPYYFELALIRLHEGNDEEAKGLLEKTFQAGVNLAPCKYFLGQLALKDNQLREAEKHFNFVLESGFEDLRGASQLYLGQIYLRQGATSAAIQSFRDALDESRKPRYAQDSSPQRRKVTAEVYRSAEAALRPFHKSGYFGSAGLSTAYDSNVLALGSGVSGVTSSSTPTGAATLKENFAGSIGYFSSPLKEVQFLPIYRTSLNINFNSATLNGEYFTHDLTLYVTKGALARTGYGIKGGLSYTLQDQPDSSNNRIFTTYSALLTIGPYIKYEMRPKLVLNVEANFVPERFFTDLLLDPSSTNQRSGVDYNTKISLRNDEGRRFWNPGISLLFDYNNTTGTEFNSMTLALEANNSLYFSEKFRGYFTASVGYARYDRRPNPQRFDTLFSFGFYPTYKLGTGPLSIYGEFQYTLDNVACGDSQVVSTYQYNRYVASAGVSFSF
ncbi:MAG: tetratricopeptide repeat protein [Bdellovibrio sp.]|nr:tetratricopeptide repeat protein [Bdellovibrio sp.]